MTKYDISKTIDIDGKYTLIVFKDTVSLKIKRGLCCNSYLLDEIPKSIQNLYFKNEYFFREEEPKTKVNIRAVNRLIRGHLGI